MNFALEWTVLAAVFGQLRELPGHQFYVEESEMRETAEVLKANSNVQQITYYQRQNGIMQALGSWERCGSEAQKCRQCGKDDLPLNQQSMLCVRCGIDNEASKPGGSEAQR